MKKLAIGLLSLLLLCGGGLYYVLTNLDALVAQVIERSGTMAVGTQVAVGEVAIDLVAGTATIRDFTIANPSGYSDDTLLRFGELSVALDRNNLSRERIGVLSVVARQPHLLYEQRAGTSNLDVIARQLQSGAPAPAADAQAGSNLELEIGSILIEDISASLRSDRLPATAEVELGDLHVENLSGTPDEVAQQILVPLVEQLSRGATLALLGATASEFTENAQEAGSRLLQRAGDGVQAAGQRLREGFGNLLNRDRDEGTDQQDPVEPGEETVP